MKETGFDLNFILVRHAHRNKLLGGESDNGLSEKGQEQAKKFAHYFNSKFNTNSLEIISSPKLRCVETVQFISEKLKVPIRLSELLNEGGNIEDKARSFAIECKTSTSILNLICSHGDIIPILINEMTGNFIELEKGDWVEIKLKNGKFLFQNHYKQSSLF